MKFSLRLGLLLLCWIILTAPPVYSQADLGARLQELDLQIESTKLSLDELGKRQRSLELEGKNLEQQISKLQEQQAATQSELELRTKQRSELDVQIQESEQRTAELQALYKRRIRTLYMYGNPGFLNEISHVDTQPMLVRNAYFLSKIRAFDANILQAIAVSKRHAETQRLELTDVVNAQQILKENLRVQQEQLSKRFADQQITNVALKKERSKQESLLVSIRAQVLRLETVLATLTNAGEAPQLKPSKKKKSRATSAANFHAYKGAGLAELKGRLPLPVPGRIVQGFGKRTEASVPPSKGIELLISEAAAVRSVADGRVIFVGKMPELSEVVIVDHGQRYYSLYGRLSRTGVAVGDEVEKGEILGKSPDPKIISPNLYFEIRNAGIAVDPEVFLEKN